MLEMCKHVIGTKYVNVYHLTKNQMVLFTTVLNECFVAS